LENVLKQHKGGKNLNYIILCKNFPEVDCRCSLSSQLDKPWSIHGGWEKRESSNNKS